MTALVFPLPLRRWFGLQAFLLLSLLLFWLPGWANEAADRDPPSRVARVAELQGQALWYDADARAWQPLLRNQTLAEGDRIRVEVLGRVGLRIGAHALWLDERGQMEIRRLDEQRIDLDLEQGALAMRWLTPEAAQAVLVRTREGRVGFERAGAYRVDQRANGSAAQVFEGRLRFDHRGGEDAPFFLNEREQAELWWDQGPRAERSRLQARDGFGEWLAASAGFGRGEPSAWRNSPAYRYVSPELTGADELDRHGRWEQSAEFGPLWLPLRVELNWAPFRHGRWTWTRHWGWTWVDDLPWGYATSHYGRWVHWRGRWCWTPGRVVVTRPVFAPALVTWVGHGSVQVGVHVGAPPVAWVPLAPHETYRPWFRHSPGYVRRLDPDPPTVRRPVPGWSGDNRSVPGAISTLGRALEGDAVGAARPVPLRDGVDARQLTPLPQAPTRQWLREATHAPAWQPAGRAPALPLAQPGLREDEGPRVRAGGGHGVTSNTRELPQEIPARTALPPAPSPEPRRELPLRPSGEAPEPRGVERDAPSHRRPVWDEPQRRLERNEQPRFESAPPARMPEVPTRRIELPRPEVQRADPPPARMPEMPTRRIEVPRQETPRTEQPLRRERDESNGPRRLLQ